MVSPTRVTGWAAMWSRLITLAKQGPRRCHSGGLIQMDILRSSVSSGLDTEFVLFISFTGSANTSHGLFALPEALHHVAGETVSPFLETQLNFWVLKSWSQLPYLGFYLGQGFLNSGETFDSWQWHCHCRVTSCHIHLFIWATSLCASEDRLF